MGQRVFIDANLLFRFGHSLKGAEAITLRDLVEVDAVDVVLTDLTLREVAKRFAKNDTEKLLELTKADLRAKAKRHLNLELPEIDAEELWTRVFDAHFATVKAFAEEVRARILKIEDVSPLAVMEDYTHSRGLFSTSSKKDQFPDAFIFEALKRDTSVDSPLIVLSSDGDFAQACGNVEHVRHVQTFEALLIELGVASAEEYAMNLVERFEEQFREPVESLLKEYMVFADDVEDGELEVISVESVSMESLTVYKSTTEEHTYLVYARMAAKAEVSFTHPNWDNAPWNSEDKVYMPFESVQGIKDVDINSEPMTFIFTYDPQSDTAMIENPTLRGFGYITATLYPQDYY